MLCLDAEVSRVGNHRYGNGDDLLCAAPAQKLGGGAHRGPAGNDVVKEKNALPLNLVLRTFVKKEGRRGVFAAFRRLEAIFAFWRDALFLKDAKREVRVPRSSLWRSVPTGQTHAPLLFSARGE